MIRPTIALVAGLVAALAATTALADKGSPTTPPTPAPPTAAATAPTTAPTATVALVVSGAWVRLPAPGARHLAAFMTWQNTGTTDIEVVSASSSMSPRTELHTHLQENGVMKMRQVERIVVKAGSSQTLQPGGLHVMLMDVPKHPVAGDVVELTLKTVGGQSVTVKVPVLATAPTSPTSPTSPAP